MKIFICGQKSFGKAVLKRLYEEGHEITGIAPPPQNIKKDKMVGYAELKGIKVVSDCDNLISDYIPEGTELIVSAHSHWMISQKCIDKCKYGGIGFHPSLLPRHRGQDAVRWTIKMRDFVSGGTIYRLGEKCDGGDILLQRMMFIDPYGWDYHELWRRLFPIGVDMVSEAVKVIQSGMCVWEKQDERFATFEPSFVRPRLKRNELLMLGGDVEDEAEMYENCKKCKMDCMFCDKYK